MFIFLVKASYCGHTRKWKSTGGSSLSDLVNAVRHKFGIGSSSLHLKYKDSRNFYQIKIVVDYWSFRR